MPDDDQTMDPGKGREHQTPYRKGVLIAKREGYSFMLNSIGPLWIIEINEPGKLDNGKIVRCFEKLGDEIQPGNVGDDVAPIWFKLEKMMRPDGARIELATHVTTEEPITL